jgi:hypothetical protein
MPKSKGSRSWIDILTELVELFFKSSGPGNRGKHGTGTLYLMKICGPIGVKELHASPPNTVLRIRPSIKPKDPPGSTRPM